MSKKNPKPRARSTQCHVISFMTDDDELQRIDAGRAAIVAVSGIPISRAAYVKAAALAHRKHRAIVSTVEAAKIGGGLNSVQIMNLFENTEGL